MLQSNQVRCEHCEYENPAGALICRRCYRLLTTNGKLPTTIAGTTGKLSTDSLKEAFFSQPSTPTKNKPFQNTIRLTIVKTGDEIVKVFRAGAMLVGRSDPARRIRPDIDLNAYNAFDDGVSRTHVILRRERNRLLVQDLNSSNKTFLNGDELAPHNPVEVQHGDDLRLGRFSMTIYFD